MYKIKKPEKILIIALFLFFSYFYLFKTGYTKNLGNYFYFSFESWNIFYLFYQILVRGFYVIFGIYTLKILGIIFLFGIGVLIYLKKKNIWQGIFILMVGVSLYNFKNFFNVFSPHLLAIFMFLLFDMVKSPGKTIIFVLSFITLPYLPLLLLLKISKKKILKYAIIVLLLFYLFYFFKSGFNIVKNYYDVLYTFLFVPFALYLIQYRKSISKILYIILITLEIILLGGNSIYFLAVFFFFILIKETLSHRWLIHFYIFIVILSVIPIFSQKISNIIYKPMKTISINYSQIIKVPVLPDSVAISKELFITQLKNKNNVVPIKNIIDNGRLLAYKYAIWDSFIDNKISNIPDDLKYFKPVLSEKNILVSKNSAYFLNDFVKYINTHTVKQLVIVDASVYSLIDCENKLNLNELLTEEKNSHKMLSAKFILLPDYLLEHAARKTLLFSIKSRLDIEEWKVIMSKGGYTLYQSPYTK